MPDAENPDSVTSSIDRIVKVLVTARSAAHDWKDGKPVQVRMKSLAELIKAVEAYEATD